MELMQPNETANRETAPPDVAVTGDRPAGPDRPSGPPPAPAPAPAGTVPPKRSLWRKLGAVGVVLAVSGSLLAFGLVERSSAQDWKSKADTRSELLAASKVELESARADADSAAKARDAAVTDASTVRADLGRITSQRDQMRTQLVAGKQVLDSMDDCVSGHDAVIAAMVDLINGVGSQSKFQSALADHNQACSAAYATANQWFNAVSALGI